ncbi:MAG: choice-of-anchor Q domain-containing protein [Planctomycetota bacterium]|jgi:hypothetical protein
MGNRTYLQSVVGISAFFLAAVGMAAGGTIYVDSDATGNNDGTSWVHAYNYLQNALAATLGGDEIWVAEGTYKPDQGGGQAPGDRTATFQLINGVAIYGGFAGSETSLDERDWQTNETILSGDIGTVGSAGDNSYHVVTSIGTDGTAVLDGFAVIMGGFGGSGGGMYNESSSATVTNCTFSGNSAASGGGMDNRFSSSVAVTNCTFIGNTGKDDGGGMCNAFWSDVAVTNCTFLGNSATNGNALACNDSLELLGLPELNTLNLGEESTLAVTNCILWDGGGEIWNDSIFTITVTYTDVQGEGIWPGVGNINADPLFADADGRLLPASPCIDAGDDAAVPPGVTTDLDGNPRIQGVSVDMGAFEAPPATPERMLPRLALFIMDEVDAGNIDTELEGSLLAKVSAAISALDRANANDAKVAMNDLKALINQVEAQTDKKMTPEVAAAIIERANAIIAALGG